MRKRVIRTAKDKRVFRNTAVKTRKINVSPNVSRGGIRL